MGIITEKRQQLRRRLMKFYTDDWVKITRKRRARQLLAFKQEHLEPLTAAQRDEILSFWKPYYDMSGELRWFEFYNKLCKDKSLLKFYIPESVYYTEIDTFFTLPRHAEELDDKNLYDLFFHDVKMPPTVIRKTGGVLLDRDYQPISLDRAVELCQACGHVVSKEPRNSAGGFGLRFFDFPETSAEEFRAWLQACSDVNVQEIIRQHESIGRLHPNSINSLRIMSMMLDGEVRILSSVIRMGMGGARVDNASSGGVACGIQPDGRLREYACDKTGAKYTRHSQGVVFKDYQIEGYDKCCALIKRLAGRMCSASNLVSWDFAVDQDGDPVLIEVNLTFGGVTIHQMCNGPIFGDMTEEILERVFHSKKK